MFCELLKRFSRGSTLQSEKKSARKEYHDPVPNILPQSFNNQNLETNVDDYYTEMPTNITIPRTLQAKMKQDSSFFKLKTYNELSTKEFSSPSLHKSSKGLFQLDHPLLAQTGKSINDDDVLDPNIDFDQNDKPNLLINDISKKYLNIPENRISIVMDKHQDFEINSDSGRIENISEISLSNQKFEILSEKNEKEEKEVNIIEIKEKIAGLGQNERRKFEKNLLMELFLDFSNDDEHFFLSTDWLAEYTLYLNNKPPFEDFQKVKTINNTTLLTQDYTLLISLLPNIHYIIVNKYIWDLLISLYGGGPVIRRDKTGLVVIEKKILKKKCDEKKIEKNIKFHKKKKKTMVIGLLNKSNYCFLNSCLQCLFSFDILNEYFLSENYKQIKQKTLKRPKFIIAYTDALKIVKTLSKRQKNVAHLSGIQKIMKKYFDPKEQQDIHEFLRIFLSEIHEELTPKAQSNNKILQQKTIIDELFEGECVTKIICRNCKNFVEISDKIMDLSLAIKRKKNCDIYDCLNRYFNEDKVVDCYKCEKCGKKSQAIKSARLVKIPKILVIHFKRFKFFPKKQKLYDYIDFPIENLDLSIFSDSLLTGKTFNLKCFASHLGNSDYGHYMAYAERDNHWFLFNDESVKNIEKERLSKREAYLLFYIRNDE